MSLPELKLPEKPVQFSVEEYLQLEKKAEFKSKFTNGFVWAIAGASPSHNAVNYNFTRLTSSSIYQRGCQGYSSDQRVPKTVAAIFIQIR